METREVAVVAGSHRASGVRSRRGLAEAGLTVVVDYHRGEAEASDVAAGIEGSGGKASAVRANVADPAAVAELFEPAAKLSALHCGGVTSAGMIKTAPFADLTDDDLGVMLDVNLKGTLCHVREAANRVADGGRIITISVRRWRSTLPVMAAKTTPRP